MSRVPAAHRRAGHRGRGLRSTKNGYRFVDESRATPSPSSRTAASSGRARATAARCRPSASRRAIASRSSCRTTPTSSSRSSAPCARASSRCPSTRPRASASSPATSRTRCTSWPRAARRSSSRRPRSSCMLGTIAAKAPALQEGRRRRARAHLQGGAQARQGRARRRLLSSSSRAARRRAQGRHAHAREPRGQRALDHGARPRRPRLRRQRRLVAAALPRHGPHRLRDRAALPRNTITFLPPLLFLKRPARWLDAISRHRGTISFGPNFAYALCVKRIKEQELAGLDLSSWRVAGCGAEPIRAENLRAFADKFAPVGFSEKAFVCCYGMAESTLAISFSKLGTGVNRHRRGRQALERAQGRSCAGVLRARGAHRPVRQRRSRTTTSRCSRPTTRRARRRSATGGRRAAPARPERDAGLLQRAGARRKRPSPAAGCARAISATSPTGMVHICGRSKEVIIVNGRNYYPQDLEWEAASVRACARATSSPSGR
jgi:hypothetical protein